MRTTTCVFLFALMNTVPSLALWALSPTDSIRVWYPTLLSYAGEHFLAAAATLILMWSLLAFGVPRIRATGNRGILPFNLLSAVGFGIVFLMADMLAGVELAALQSRDGGSIRLWHTGRLADYFYIREPIYACFAAAVLVVAALRGHRKLVHR